MPLVMIFLLPVGRIRNLAWSSSEVLQFSQPTKIPNCCRDCRAPTWGSAAQGRVEKCHPSTKKCCPPKEPWQFLY